jgi:hypothetical protein
LDTSSSELTFVDGPLESLRIWSVHKLEVACYFLNSVLGFEANNVASYSSFRALFTLCMTLRLLLNIRAVLGLFYYSFTDLDEFFKSCRWVLSGLASGAATGALLSVFVISLAENISDHALLTVIGPPVIMLIFCLGEVAALSVLSRAERPGIREWFAAVGAKLLMASVFWASLFGIVMYSFEIMQLIYGWIGGAAWLLSSIGTARIAFKSEKTGMEKSPLNLLIKAGPPIFLIGLILFVSQAVGYGLAWNIDKTLRVFNMSDLMDNTRMLSDPLQVQPLLPFCVAILSFSFLIVLWSSWNPSEKQKLTLKELATFCAVSLVIAFLMLLWGWIVGGLPTPLVWCSCTLFFAIIIGRFVDINIFSLQELYQNRLVRCYLGASRPSKTNSGSSRQPAPLYVQPDSPGGSPRNPEPLTGFDEFDDFRIDCLDPSSLNTFCENNRNYSGPFHLFCTALNLVRGDELAWQERMAESFTFSPLHAGSIGTGYRKIGRKEDSSLEQYGSGMTVGQAVSLSGAAVSPNMGYYSSAPVTALLTIFNLRLGAWLGNPKNSTTWMRPGPRYGWLQLIRESLGFTSAEDDYVYISDGGHFDNLGAYELIRRRCKIVICCDAGADPKSSMHELGMLVRKVRTDFGIRIDIGTDSLKPNEKGICRSHVAVGRIRYSDRHEVAENKKDELDGYLLYIKPSFTGDEPSDTIDYRTSHPDFPHQTTVDQFFSESQFESYRALGYHAITSVFENSVKTMRIKKTNFTLMDVVGNVRDRFESHMSQDELDRYLSLNDDYARLHNELGTNPQLRQLAVELKWIGDLFDAIPKNLSEPDQISRRTSILNMLKSRQPSPLSSPAIEYAERHMLIQMMTLLENVFFAFNLASYDVATDFGWMQVLIVWTHTTTFSKHWNSFKQEFSIEFRTFIDQLR